MPNQDRAILTDPQTRPTGDHRVVYGAPPPKGETFATRPVEAKKGPQFGGLGRLGQDDFRLIR